MMQFGIDGLGRLVIGGALLLAMPQASWGGEIEATSQIRSVTVFPIGALVRREAEVDLPQGASTLVFRGFPHTVDPASLRVEGQAEGALVLGSVDVRLTPGDPGKGAGPLDDRIKALRAERERKIMAIESLEGRKAMVLRFSQSGPERGDGESGLDVAQWPAAWEAVGTALAQVNDALLAARKALADVEAELRAAEQAGNARRGPVGAPQRDFLLSVEAATPVKGKLTLTYRVEGAQWRPTYDAAFTSGSEGKGAALTLTRRAIVTQRTGEDWSDVELALSTARVTGGTSAPELYGQRVSFVEFPPPMPMAMARREARMEAAADASRKTAPPMTALSAPAPAMPAAQQEAEVDAGDWQSVFKVPGVLSIPRDGAQKSVVIQSRQIVPDVLVTAVPVLDPNAYLQASFALEDETPLLAGDVSLMRDGMFVGRGRIDFAAPGEKVAIGFGPDDKVKVNRVALKRRETDPSLIGSTRTDLRDYKITARNLHGFPVKVRVIDQIPYSEASSLGVEALPTNTPPTEKTVDDRRGVVAWSFELKPREQRDLRNGYRLRFPADREIRFDRIAQPH